jgi:hypothetical protein
VSSLVGWWRRPWPSVPVSQTQKLLPTLKWSVCRIHRLVYCMTMFSLHAALGRWVMLRQWLVHSRFPLVPIRTRNAELTNWYCTWEKIQ